MLDADLLRYQARKKVGEHMNLRSALYIFAAVSTDNNNPVTWRAFQAMEPWLTQKEMGALLGSRGRTAFPQVMAAVRDRLFPKCINDREHTWNNEGGVREPDGMIRPLCKHCGTIMPRNQVEGA